jgi:hypothetical protein
MLKQYHLATGMLVGWSGLGFYRGHQHCLYKASPENNTPFYRVLSGYAGAVCYLDPLLFFLVVPKELYRLQVDFYALDEEDKKYYNTLF